MLGPFATASRRTPPVLILHCHSPGVATVARCLRIDVHNNNTTTTTTTRDRGDRYGPTEWAQLHDRRIPNVGVGVRVSVGPVEFQLKCMKQSKRHVTYKTCGLCGVTVERSLATQKVVGSNLGRSASK